MFRSSIALRLLMRFVKKYHPGKSHMKSATKLCSSKSIIINLQKNKNNDICNMEVKCALNVIIAY